VNLKARISRLEQTSHQKENSEQQAYLEECICYPKLRYGLSFKSDEMRAAEELPCPLHGNRIPNPQETVYCPDGCRTARRFSTGRLLAQGNESSMRRRREQVARTWRHVNEQV
jgi:hypothetical protein